MTVFGASVLAVQRCLSYAGMVVSRFTIYFLQLPQWPECSDVLDPNSRQTTSPTMPPTRSISTYRGLTRTRSELVRDSAANTGQHIE